MLKYIAIGLAVIAVIIAAISSFLSPNDLAKCQPEPNSVGGCQKADAIISISGGNTSVRAAEAIKLYKNGWANLLIFSGAAQDESSPSNAKVMREQALAAGVPADNIVIEEDARTTHQNANNINEILRSQQISNVIIVTSPYHQRRAGFEFSRSVNGTVHVRNHPAPNDPDWSAFWWLTFRGWWLAGGELIKLIVVSAGGSA